MNNENSIERFESFNNDGWLIIFILCLIFGGLPQVPSVEVVKPIGLLPAPKEERKTICRKDHNHATGF